MSHADANGARVAAHSRGENRYRGLKNGSTASTLNLCVVLKRLCSLKLHSLRELEKRLYSLNSTLCVSLKSGSTASNPSLQRGLSPLTL